jgi:hypothetical protein
MIQPLSFSSCGQNLSDSNPDKNTLQKNIIHLIDTYCSEQILERHLQELPQQFKHPEPRAWPLIPWHDIHPNQISGIDLDLFLLILEGAINTEAPIRDYTQASRQYLEPLHPAMADYVGGKIGAAGQVISLGLWEKEERRHTPALLKLYRQLSGDTILPTPHTARPHLNSSTPREDLYRHGLHRVATEYGAACLYLWLMAHCTGPLAAVMAELTRDEINHLTKFWGFGTWFFPETSLSKVMATVLQPRNQPIAQPHNLLPTFQRMAVVLAWSRWSLLNKLSFGFTCSLVLHRLWGWHRRLAPATLIALLGEIKK